MRSNAIRKEEVHAVKRLLVFGVIVAAAVAGVAIAVAATTRDGSSAARSGAATISLKQFAGRGKVLVDAKGRAL
jgi:hypothetical protein